MKKILLFSVLFYFLASCSKEDDCTCELYTKKAYDVYTIEKTECQPERAGIDQNGNEFWIKCY